MKKKMGQVLLAGFLMFFLLPHISYARSLDSEGFISDCAQIMETLACQDRSNTDLNTGVIVENDQQLKDLYDYFNNLYYNGNTGVCLSGRRFDGSRMYVLVRTQGSSHQAYEEHVEATRRYQSIAQAIPGAASQEALNGIYDYIYTNVVYADANTIETIQRVKKGNQIDYGAVKATGYTAVMDGISTCVGYSVMFQRLCAIKGIPGAIIRNRNHQYNMVMVNGAEVYYDMTADTYSKKKYLYSGKSYEELMNIDAAFYEAAKIYPYGS